MPIISLHLHFEKHYYYTESNYYFTKVVATRNIYNVVNMAMISYVNFTMTDVTQLLKYVYKVDSISKFKFNFKANK